MMITHVVVNRDSTIVGVRIQDGDLAYPIVLEALYTRVIFQELLKSGWTYSGHPYKFSKDGKQLANLDRIQESTLSVAEQSEFHIVSFDKMKQEELNKYIPKRDADAIPLRAPINTIIQDRKELVHYLKSWAQLPEGYVYKYMPLNSMTNPEALFTPEEIMDPKNRTYLDILNRRRVISYFQYKELVTLFLEMGLKEDYTALDVMDMYFSWGLCGIKDTLISKRNEKSLFRLGDSLSSSTEYVTERRGILTNSAGNAYADLPTGWAIKTVGISSPDPNAFGVSMATRNSTEEIHHLSFTHMSASFSTSGMVMKVPGVIHQYHLQPLRVTYPASVTGIPFQQWNISNPDTVTKIQIRMFARTLARQIMESLRINSDSSSLRALMGIGLTEKNAMEFILHDLMRDIQQSSSDPSALKDVGKYSLLLESIESFLRDGPDGFEATEPKMTQTLALPMDDIIPEVELRDFVDSVREGDLNVGNVLTGSVLDASGSVDSLEQIIALAIENFGCSLESIMDSARALSIGDDGQGQVVFVAPDGESYVSHKLSVGNRKLNGFRADMQEYSHRAADTAKVWMYVTKAYTIPSHSGKFDHVAVSYLNFPHAKTSNGSVTLHHPEIETYFNDIITAHITRAVDTKRKQMSHFRNLSIYISRAVFEAYLEGEKGYVTLPTSLGGGQLPISQEIVGKIRKPGVVFSNVESLYGISDYMTMEGSFFFFCANARLYNDAVRPYKGFTVRELPLLPNWYGFKGTLEQKNADLNSRREKGWLEAGIVPEPISVDYEVKSAHNYRTMEDASVYTHKYSLAKYESSLAERVREYRRTQQCQIDLLPTLEEIDLPWANAGRCSPCEPSEFQTVITHSKIRDITAEIIDAEREDVVARGRVTQQPTQVQSTDFIKVTGLYAADIMEIGLSRALDVLENMSKSVRAIYVYSDDAIMANKETLNKAVDKTTLAYYRSSTMEYLMDSRGEIHAREVRQ